MVRDPPHRCHTLATLELTVILIRLCKQHTGRAQPAQLPLKYLRCRNQYSVMLYEACQAQRKHTYVFTRTLDRVFEYSAYTACLVPSPPQLLQRTAAAQDVLQFVVITDGLPAARGKKTQHNSIHTQESLPSFKARPLRVFKCTHAAVRMEILFVRVS